MKLPRLLAATALCFVIGIHGVPEVKVGKTTVVGREFPSLKQEFFGGIPYAEPPLGDLRLRPPVLKSALDVEPFNASSFGPSCLQPLGLSGAPSGPISEDCLTINVFRPSGLPPNAKLPVLFWVYGGGFVAGSSVLYNGSAIVARSVERGTPVIYVNFNYRLGPLGFPQGVEAGNNKALNLGLKDELAALQWVQDNIGAFGGDKAKVTIFGESAGAIMNAILFLNSGLENFAWGAILESGSQATSYNSFPARRQVDWDNFVSGVASCFTLAGTKNTFDCLRSANSSEILAGLQDSVLGAPEEFGFDPTIDGPGGIYPDLPSRLFAKGKFSRIPFISGTNLDEGTVFIPGTISSEAEIRDFFTANFTPPVVSPADLQNALDQLLHLYPDIPSLGSPFNTGNDTFGLSSQYKRACAIQGDLAFTSQRRFWQQTAANASVKTWGYLFAQPQPQLPPTFGVPHQAEVDYVYGAPADPSSSALRISILMIDYWVSFATSLDPNDGKGMERPRWEQFTPNNQRIIQLNGDNTTMIDDTFRRGGWYTHKCHQIKELNTGSILGRFFDGYHHPRV
ncbi:hypothetical protein NP233_g4716 [Leucocoprinus birnbaumii]|uniref:Carboxylic ester hydrolase n=1 Tax=Leucocoprinus birnbaumii TaxID=56174 RepID=A0AAD5VVJ1_9AGAR|nr:hypothetical protein NP233_g4716 [Leucocoprinus birnbaumii]